MFIETYIIRLLAAFSERGTLSGVGEALNVTQPTITRAMQKLERELGVSLFDRTKNRVALNENGALAADYARRIMALQDEMIQKTREKAGLRTKCTVGSVAIQPALNAVCAAERVYPGIEAEYRIDDDEASLIQGLSDGTYQMIILLSPLDDDAFTSRRYFSERLSVMLPRTHRLASRTSLALADLAGETFAVYSDIGFWDKVKQEKIPGAKFVRLVHQDEDDPLLAIISASDLPSFISDRTTAFTMPADRVAVPLSDEEMSVTFWAVCRRESAEDWRLLLSEMESEGAA